MPETTGPGLEGISRTLLLPLWGRYSESMKENGLIRDEKCMQIVKELGIDFSEIQGMQHPASRLAWVARAWNVDRELRRIIDDKGEVTVVCLGAGLDTAYFRIGAPPQVHWYDIDLPDVTSLRRRLLGEKPRSIGGSALDAETYVPVKVAGYLVVLAVGLLYYFDKDEVRTIFRHIGALAPESTVIFDYCSALGVAAANKLVLHTSEGARMIWSADTEDDLQAMCHTAGSIVTYPLYAKITPLLSEKETALAEASDRHRIMSFAVIVTACR